MSHALRRLAAAALLTLCAAPAALPQATNLPARANTTFGLNTNGVVKVPYGQVTWLTQTNIFARATITNLTVSSITGVDGTEVAITDAGSYFATNNVEAALQSLGASVAGAVGDVVGVTVSGGLLTVSSSGGPTPDIGLSTSAVRNATAIYLPLAGGTMAGNINMGASYSVTNLSSVLPAIAVSPSSGSGNALGSNSIGWDRVYATGLFPPDSFSVTNTIWLIDGILSGAWSVSESLTAGSFIGPGAGITALTAGNLVGDIPAAGFGEVAIRWTDRDFHLEEGTTNSVGWVSYTNTSGSRRYTIDALCSAITTDQAATLRSTVVRVPRGFTAFKTTGALRVTWVSNDSAGDNEVRGLTLTGWSDITSTETVLHTDSVTRDVSAAGTPTTISINLADFSSGLTTVPQWVAVDVRFSVEDSDKTGILLVELLSQ